MLNPYKSAIMLFIAKEAPVAKLDGNFRYMCIRDRDKVDEERRLCYVGITRAKQLLYLTNCASRNLYSGSNENHPSRFLDDIPEGMLDMLAASAPVRDVYKRQFQYTSHIRRIPKSEGDIFAGRPVRRRKGRGKPDRPCLLYTSRCV